MNKVKYIVYTYAYQKACHVQYTFTFKNEVDIDENVQCVSKDFLNDLCIKNEIIDIETKLIFYNGNTYNENLSHLSDREIMFNVNEDDANELALFLETDAEVETEKWIDSNKLSEEDIKIIERLEKLYKDKGMKEIYKAMWNLRQGVKCAVPYMLETYLNKIGY